MSEVFMCWVEGSIKPRKRHPTLDIAMEEAKRLSGLPDVTGRVFVLADVAVIEKQQQAAPIVIVKKKRLPILPE